MQKVIDKLESIGVSVNEYRRGPAGKEAFAIGLDSKRLLSNEGYRL